MSNYPKVSVIMPVFNAEKYLQEAIQSILDQTFKDFEFIIIDDGSKDKSIAIIQSFNDPRIKFFINEKNLG
jgi:glycosyltransferase involved in cell wall biosynthesis